MNNDRYDLRKWNHIRRRGGPLGGSCIGGRANATVCHAHVRDPPMSLRKRGRFYIKESNIHTTANR